MTPLIEDANAPDSEVEQVVSSVIALVSEKFRGPIPHPKHFKEYEAILSGAADRILKMTEVTVQHDIDAARRELGLAERDAEIAKVEVVGEQKYQNLGLVLGFMALLAMIAGAIWLGLSGQPAGAIWSACACRRFLGDGSDRRNW